MSPNERMKETVKNLGKSFAYYLKCKLCGDTANEDELQITKGHCPTCNNKGFDEITEDERY